MDIVESIERYIAGTDLMPGTRTRLVRARDEIVRLRKSQSTPDPEQPSQQGSVKFNCAVVDDDHPKGVPLSQWGQQEPVAFGKANAFAWEDKQSERVVKLTRKAQPEHGFTEPLYTRPQAREPLTDTNRQFNAAIDFAIEQGREAALFLSHWREGDTAEWPEFNEYLAAHGTGEKK